MQSTMIGLVEVHFTEDGKITNSEFAPMLKIKADEILIEKFSKIRVTPDELDVRLVGELMLGKFFSKITEIELSDREKYTITSETLACDKYADGKVKRCVIGYSFTPLA